MHKLPTNYGSSHLFKIFKVKFCLIFPYMTGEIDLLDSSLEHKTLVYDKMHHFHNKK